MFDPGPCVYMEKIAAGEEAADVLDIDAPVGENLHRLAKVQNTSVSDLTVVILDRPRHEEIVSQVREAGARIKFIPDGDVAGAIAAAREDTGDDLYIGIGGTPEGVLQTRLWPRDEAERDQAVQAGYDIERVLSIDDLVSSDDVFFAATGVTDGDLVKGVHYRRGRAVTQSIVMRSRSGTVRVVDAWHLGSKVKQYYSGTRP